MINVNQITSQLAKMPDPMLQKFAEMHKDDPYTVSLALSESNRRKEMRAGVQAKMAGQEMPKVVDQEIGGIAPQPVPQGMPQGMPQGAQQLPENVGIGALPAQNLQKMAGGGIVAFDEGGEVPRYQNKGAVEGGEGPAQYRAYALKKAEEMGLDPIWVDRIFSHESKTQKSPMGYDPDAVSPTGATGIGQLVKNTANHYMRKVGHLGLQDKFDPEIRKDPYKNIDASMAYMADLQKKYKGDPRLMAVAYNQGETYLDNHLKENKGKLNPEALKAEPKNYLQKTVEAIIPSAQAATPDKRMNEIPAAVTKESKAAQAADTSGPRAITGNQAIIGAGETGLQYLTGLAAIPTAGAYSLYRKAMYGEDPEANFRKYAGEVTYSPRTEGGKAVSEGLGQTLEDLKIPPYLAHMGNVSPRKGSPNIKADLAELAAEKTRQAETPRLAGPSTDPTMIQGRGEPPVKQGRAVANQMADIQDAAAWREAAAKAGEGSEGTRPEVLERNAAIDRAQNVARATSPAVTAGVAGDEGKFVPGQGLPENWGSDLGKEAPPKPEGIETLVKSDKKGDNLEPSKFKDEMALQFFLGLMGGQSPNMFTNVSQAGLGALKYGQEAKKEESDRLYKEAMAKHYGKDPLLQRLEAFKDPETLRMYNMMKEAEGEPALMRELVTEYLKNPAGMSVLKSENPALYSAIRMQASRVMAPRPMSELPGAGAATRPPV